MDELQPGLTAVAGPIRAAHGDVVASVGVSGPTLRLRTRGLQETVSAVCRAAAEVSRRLGRS